VLNSDPTVKMLAIGMAFAVLIDASLVRMILVPAIMTLLGRHAWWMPRWLEPIVPHLQLEGSDAAAPVPAGVGPIGESTVSDSSVASDTAPDMAPDLTRAENPAHQAQPKPGSEGRHGGSRPS
jgi:uncharacterized membrane protein YdfJ with MMPL/SSD domain